MEEKRVSIIFYLEEKRYIYSLEDIIRNSHNGKIAGSLFERKEEILFPFSIADQGIFIYDKLSSQIGITSIDRKSSQAPVMHGNLYRIRDFKKNQIYYILFLERKNMDLQFDRFLFPAFETITVGRSSSNRIQYSISNVVARENQLVLHKDGNGRIHMDIPGSNGMLVYVNGKRYQGSVLRTGDEIQYLGLLILCLEGGIAVSRQDVACYRMQLMTDPIVYMEKESEDNRFNRTFRLSSYMVRKSVFEIDAPPAAKEEEQPPLLLSIGPSFTMAMAMMASAGVSVSNALQGGNIATVVTGCSMAVSMLMAAILWPSLLRRHHRKKIDDFNRARVRKYQHYIKEREEEVIQEEEYNRKILGEYYHPSPEVQMNFLLGKEIHRLWERSRKDQDFLVIRLGKGVGANLSRINIPRQKFSMQEDDLAKLPDVLADKHKLLYDVPITISLFQNRRIGLVGKESEISDLVQLIILNIMSLHAPDEVKLAFIGTEEKLKKIGWFEKLPHIWNWNRTRRLIAVNGAESIRLYGEIRERKDLHEEYYIIIVTDPELIRGAQWKTFIEKEAVSDYSFVFAYGDYYILPRSCDLLVQWGNSECYIQKKNEKEIIQKDLFPWEKIQGFVSIMNRLILASGAEEKPIPDIITYLQMYKVGNVKDLEIEQRWKTADASSSLSVPIGMGANGELICLDIHERFHGCHGLVAGMTGAGKSEFLQAYITSLMIQFSPEDVAFVLIDFKGGDMARPYVNSPYLAATISNLTESILRRALISLRAEIRERELLFNEEAQRLGTGKMDINLYIKYYKEERVRKAVPHLFIVVDEFAQLKKQNLEFLEELVNIAQVGRSIGIHLILATQKPAGIVDPQIAGNSRFRVCLKVQSKQDSADMIESTEAASIKQAGRFYMMVGYRELFLQAQSGYAGCTYKETEEYIDPEERKVSMVDHMGCPYREAVVSSSQKQTDLTQMEAVLKEINHLAREKNLVVNQLWQPELKEIIYADNTIYPEMYEENAMPVPIGVGDFVKERTQEIIYADLYTKGHIAICGLSETGKTTLVQTILWGMAYRYSPEKWNLYYLDLSGKSSEYYKRMPHCRKVVFDDKEENIAELLLYLLDHMEERKILFAEEGCNTYQEYIRQSETGLPALVFVVDHYAPFREKYYRLEEQIVELVSSGKTYGIYLILTGNSKSAIYYKVMEHISQVYLLQLNDIVAYQILLKAGSNIAVPEAVKGRGICKTDRGVVEFQTLLINQAEHEAQRRKKLIQDICVLYPDFKPEDIFSKEEKKNILKVNIKKAGIQKAEVNEVGIKKQAMTRMIDRNLYEIERPKAIRGHSEALVAGYSLSGQLKYGISLPEFHSFLITGEEGEQKIPLLLYLIENLLLYSKFDITIVDFGKRMKPYQPYISECRYIDNNVAFDKWCEKLYLLSKKKEKDTGEFILAITDFQEFFDGVSDQAADWLRELCRNQVSYLHTITAAVMSEKLSMYNVDELYEYLIKTKSGLLCDGVIQKSMYVYLHTQMKEILLAYEGKVYTDEKALFFHEGKAVEVNVR